MEDQIVNLVIPVNQCGPVFWLFRFLREKRHHVVEVGYLADFFARINVFSPRLGNAQGAECFQLSIIKAGMSAKVLQAY
jgi:hypothetical protein